MAWQQLARRQHGMITHAQLLMCGLSARSVEMLELAGRLERRRRGLFIVGGAPLTYSSALWTALLATGGTLGFATAAHLWGMIAQPPDTIDVIVATAPGRRPPAGVRLHRVQLRDADRERHQGFVVTRRVASALDYLSRQPRPSAVRFADRALQQKWITPADIEDRLNRQKGRTGNNRLRQILTITADGAAAKSERRLHELLRAAGIAGWTPNLRVGVPGRFEYLVDIGWEELRLAIELDGMAHHVDTERFQGDRTRQNVLVNAGWTVLRFTWWDVTERPRHVIASVRAAISARNPR